MRQGDIANLQSAGIIQGLLDRTKPEYENKPVITILKTEKR